MEAFREYGSEVDQVNELIADRMGVNRTDHRVMEILNRLGPMTAGDLADATRLTTGAVTAVVDRLERIGYARRIRDTVDRRRVRVEQPPEGAKTGRRQYGPFMQRSLAAMQNYSAEQLAAVRDFMREVTVIAAEYGERLRAERTKEPE